MNRAEYLDRRIYFRRLFGWLLALVVLAAPAILSAAADDAVVIYPSAQGRAEPANGFIRLGLHRQTVLFVLGEPSHKLNDNLWVYRGFRCDAPSARRFDTLVLQFENNWFTAFKFVDQRTLKAAVALFNRTHVQTREDLQVIGARK